MKLILFSLLLLLNSRAEAVQEMGSHPLVMNCYLRVVDEASAEILYPTSNAANSSDALHVFKVPRVVGKTAFSVDSGIEGIVFQIEVEVERKLTSALGTVLGNNTGITVGEISAVHGYPVRKLNSPLDKSLYLKIKKTGVEYIAYLQCFGSDWKRPTL